MFENLLLNRINNMLSNEDPSQISLHGLSDEEVKIAQGINKIVEDRKRFKEISNIFFHAFGETERFYEMSIRALSALIRVGKLGEKAKNMRVLCRQVIKIFSEDLEFENCSIMLKDAEGKFLELIAGKGKGDKYIGIKSKRGSKIKIGDGVAGLVAKTGKHIFIPDVESDPRFKQMPTKIAIKSLLSVPLRDGKKVIGVMNFSHPLLESFDENKVNLMILLANFVGQIITLSILHNKIADWNETLRREISEKTKELKAKNKELKKMAFMDALTGLTNRFVFFRRLEEEFMKSLRYSDIFSLLLFDIDNLKLINDTYGHLYGDRVLKAFSMICKKVCRKYDIISRLGGDEFGCIMIKADAEAAKAFAQRLKKEFDNVNFHEVEIKPTISIGIADSRSKEFSSYMEIFKAADEALYVSKKQKNAVTIYGSQRK